MKRYYVTRLTSSDLDRFPRTVRYDGVGGDRYLVSWETLPSGRVDVMARGPIADDDTTWADVLNPREYKLAHIDEYARIIAGLGRTEPPEPTDDADADANDDAANGSVESRPYEPLRASPKVAKVKGVSFGARDAGWSLHGHLQRFPYVTAVCDSAHLENTLNQLRSLFDILAVHECVTIPDDPNQPYGSGPTVLVICVSKIWKGDWNGGDNEIPDTV